MQAIHRSSCIILFCAIILLYINLLANLPVRLPFSPPLLPFSRWPSCRLKQGKLARLVRKSKSFRQRWSTRIRIGVLLETIVGCAQQSSKFEHPRCLFFLRFFFSSPLLHPTFVEFARPRYQQICAAHTRRCLADGKVTTPTPPAPPAAALHDVISRLMALQRMEIVEKYENIRCTKNIINRSPSAPLPALAFYIPSTDSVVHTCHSLAPTGATVCPVCVIIFILLLQPVQESEPPSCFCTSSHTHTEFPHLLYPSSAPDPIHAPTPTRCVNAVHTVAIVGVGGVGSVTAEMLTRQVKRKNNACVQHTALVFHTARENMG